MEPFQHDATSSSSMPSTANSVNLGDDGGSYGSLDRPPGRKAKKARLRKSKSKEAEGDATSSELVNLVNLLVEMKEDKKVMNEKKFEMFEKCYLQEHQRLLHVKEKMQMEQLKEEERIMSIDTSCMPPLQAEYFQRRQMEILGKKM